MEAIQPTLYLIHGFIGAGKTTYARWLEEQTGAIRFTHDEWMTRLYGTNPPANVFPIYAERVTSLIWNMAEACLRRGVSVILDFGFWEQNQREEAFQRGTEWGACVELHAVECPEATMLKRTLARTSTLPQGALEINEEAFYTLKKRFQPLTEAERRRATIIPTGNAE